MYSSTKRVFDVGLALVSLVVLSPLLLIAAVAIKLDSPGPVFYRGERAGKDGTPFRIFKFRTMVSNAERLGGPSTSADDPRITRAGHFLRRLKIDEFPQIINILRGEMSFVGPRPEVLQEVERYGAKQRELLTVLPGMVDYATLEFHNEEELLAGSVDPHETYRRLIQPEKIRLGLAYVTERSLWVDVKILSRFILTLFATRLPRIGRKA